MSKEKKPITAFVGVFEEKLERMKRSLKEELKKAKSERRIDWLKEELKQAKSLRNTLREVAYDKKCPHCGGKL
jgi:DNA repair exonuclease SbcCD ATPase subunit